MTSLESCFVHKGKKKKQLTFTRGFPGSSDGKESACNEETWVPSLGYTDPLQKEMANHSSILA